MDSICSDHVCYNGEYMISTGLRILFRDRLTYLSIIIYWVDLSYIGSKCDKRSKGFSPIEYKENTIMPQKNQSAAQQRINRYFKSLRKLELEHDSKYEHVPFAQLFDMDVDELNQLMKDVKKIKNAKVNYAKICDDDRYGEDELELLQRRCDEVPRPEPAVAEPEPEPVVRDANAAELQPEPEVVEVVVARKKRKRKRKKDGKPKVNKALWNYGNDEPEPLYDEIMLRTSNDYDTRNSLMLKAKHVYQRLGDKISIKYDEDTFDLKQALVYVAKLAKKYKILVDLYSPSGIDVAVSLIDTAAADHVKYEKLKLKLDVAHAMISKRWELYDL